MKRTKKVLTKKDAKTLAESGNSGVEIESIHVHKPYYICTDYDGDVFTIDSETFRTSFTDLCADIIPVDSLLTDTAKFMNKAIELGYYKLNP